ncbi:MAG: aldo/keto reductase [Clostridia bacterium]|nr:aldo/keto reductase [Clostridia bacterium]
MKKLGFGCMRLPLKVKKINGSVDLIKTKEMVDYYLDEGFTYFDTAYMYHDGRSERSVREALVSRYERERFILADKMPVGMLVTKGDTSRIFRHQLKRCGVEYFDYYLLHALNAKYLEKAEKLGVFRYLAKKKVEGKIKKLGFSFHDSAEVLDNILTKHPEMEFVQLQINYLDWEDANVQSRLCYEIARKHGKDIIVMEPVKGGKLADVPEKVRELFAGEHPDWSPASWAVRFAASLEGVICVLSGMSDMSQLRDNTGYMKDFAPLTEKETDIVKKAAAIINNSETIPCTSCRYCTASCPMNIAIPEYFTAYNKKAGGEEYKTYLEQNAKDKGKADECINCKKCEEVCPQHISVTEKLSLVTKTL